MANTERALICHVIYRLAVGGLENGLVNLINRLPADTYRHAIICLTEATEFSARICRNDVQVHELGKKPGKDIALYGRLWRLLRRMRPAIVHTRNLPALDCVFAAKAAGVPRLLHGEHGRDTLELTGQNRKYNNLRRLSRSVVDQYVAVSQDLCDWLRVDIGLPAARINLIYNGVDAERFTPLGPGKSVLPADFAPTGSIVLGTVGRFEAVKNPQLLAKAFGLILESRPQLRRVLRLILIGDGVLRPDIEGILTQYQANNLAWLPGFCNDTPSLHRALDIFVLPSLREGISNTALEAMASGRPVVATRVGGSSEIIPDGIAGQLVVTNDANVLAAAILRYIDHPSLAREHGEAGRKHVMTNFSLSSMVEKYDALYRAQLRCA